VCRIEIRILVWRAKVFGREHHFEAVAAANTDTNASSRQIQAGVFARRAEAAL